MKVSEFNQTMAYLLRPEPRQMLAKGTQPRTAAGTFGKVYSMAEIRKLAKELNVSEFVDGVKLTPDQLRSNVTKALARTNFYKNQFKSLSSAKQKAYMKDFKKQIVKHQDGGFYLSAKNRVPNATFVKRYFPNINPKTANKIVTSINGVLLNDFIKKGNVLKSSPKANANVIRRETLSPITDLAFETAEGVQGTKGVSLQHVASKNRMVKLNNLAYLEKVLNSSGSQNDKRIKIIEKEVDRLIKAKPKNYIQRINDLNTEGMALASGYIKKDGKIIKGPTAGYSEFRVKDPINQKEYFFGKDDTKTILPDKDPVLIQQDADLIDKPIKDMNPEELKRAKEIAKKKQIDFRKAMSGAGKVLKGVGKVIKPIGYAFGPAAVMSARAKADDMGIELSIEDQAKAFDAGDADVAIDSYRRRTDPEFAAQERAKDLAKMTDDFEEVGLDDIGMQEYTEDYAI
jgi:hypothetical protein|tara:strand:- start:13 stop:1383 length:1371 start_codon:yes stop_codon:yes gene_type:complete